MNEKGCNGWTNYETWNVKLWMDNERGSDEYWREQAEHAYKWAVDRGVGFSKEEQSVLDLAAMLKDEHETAMHDLLDNAKASASMWADLLGAALSEVNWHEIAEHMIEDVDKEAEVEVD